MFLLNIQYCYEKCYFLNEGTFTPISSVQDERDILNCYMPPIKDLLWLAETSLHWLWQIMMSNSDELKTG